MNINSFFLFALLTLSISCGNPFASNNDCMENPGKGKLFVFVGEKIEVKEVPPEENVYDAKFLAKYKVIENVCGNYQGDTIEFIVYDHHGRPAFSEFKNVLLYVVEYDGIFFHEKYQYHDLFKTVDGRWASPFDRKDNSLDDTSINAIKPEIINFKEEISYSFWGLKKQEIKYKFPQPYFEIINNKAIAKYGNYVPELFELKKRAVLGWRGLFGKREDFELPVVDIEMNIEYPITKLERKALTMTYYELMLAVKQKNKNKIRELSIDSVVCSVCEGFGSSKYYNDVEPIDSFINASFQNFPGSALMDTMKRRKPFISAYYSSIAGTSYLQPENESFIKYEVSFSTTATIEGHRYSQYHRFQFVNKNGKFKFYGMESH